MQRETPPRLSQMTTQPMEWTPTPIKGEDETRKAPPRHTQEITRPRQVTGCDTQCRLIETGSGGSFYTSVRELYAQYKLTGELIQEVTQPMA